MNAILAKTDYIMALEQENDVEGCFRALISIILRIGEDKTGAAITDMVNRLISVTDAEVPGSRCRLRLQLLLVLFNLLSLDSIKYSTIMAVLKYAMDTKQAPGVAAFHTRVPGWVDTWKLNKQEQRNMYSLVRNLLQVSPATANTADSRKYFLHYLSTFAKDAPLPADAAAYCISAVTEFVSTSASAFDERATLLDALSEKHVTSHSKLQSLRSILVIICNGSLAEYQAFAKQNDLQALNLDSTELEQNMRLLALCAVATTKDTMTYEEVAAALVVSVDEVELWVVTAIAQNVLEANLNQNTRVLTITRCSYRSFGMNQWQDVQKKLRALRDSVSSVFDEMQR